MVTSTVHPVPLPLRLPCPEIYQAFKHTKYDVTSGPYRADSPDTTHHTKEQIIKLICLKTERRWRFCCLCFRHPVEQKVGWMPSLALHEIHPINRSMNGYSTCTHDNKASKGNPSLVDPFEVVFRDERLVGILRSLEEYAVWEVRIYSSPLIMRSTRPLLALVFPTNHESVSVYHRQNGGALLHRGSVPLYPIRR